MEIPIPRSRIGSLTLGLIILSLALVALPASAARWQTMGPDDDGTVLSLAFAPSKPTVVYAGTLGGGVSRSLDGGRTWAAARAGLTSPVVGALAVFPGDHRVVWAATEDGLYRSLDAAHTWSHVFTERVNAVAVDPGNPAIVYIGTRNGLFRSGNSGQTWLPMGEGLVPIETRFWVSALVAAPSRSQTLYAAYLGARSGIFRSENGGIAWSRIYSGEISHLAVNPRVPETLWAADRRGLLLTTDGGTTWTRVLWRARIGALALSRDGQRIYVAAPGQVLMSRDDGAHWRRVGTGLPLQPVYGLAVDPVDAARVLAGPEARGAFGVDSAIARWRRSSDGLVGFAAEAIGPAPDGSGLFVASRLGLYQTADQGVSWTRKLPGIALRAVMAAPADAMTVYAAGEVRGEPEQPALYCSHDGGASWMSMEGGITQGEILSLAVHPEIPNIAYAGTRYGVFTTTDYGHHWTALSLTGKAAGLAIDTLDPATLYATQGPRLVRSRDGGATWHVVLGEMVPVPHDRTLVAAAVAPTDSKSLAAIDGHRIYLSRDGGLTWQTLVGPAHVTHYRTVAFVPWNEQLILLGGEGGAALSTDGGATWQKLGAGLSGLTVNQLRYDPDNPGRLYAATWAAGAMVLDPAP